MVLFVSTACGRSTQPTEQYRPSAEPDILLPLVERGSWSVKLHRPVLDYREGSPQAGAFRGFHLDADGTVWTFFYSRQNADVGHCDIWKLPRTSAAATEDWYQCFFADSRLVARLGSESFAEFERQARNIADSGRVELGAVADGSFAGIRLSEYIRPDGKALLVAGCGTPKEVDQLVSPEAQYIVELWHRLRRVIPQSSQPGACMFAPREPAPGVQGWWLAKP